MTTGPILRRACGVLAALALAVATTIVGITAAAPPAAATTVAVANDAQLRTALADANVTHIDLTADIIMNANCAGGTYTRADLGGDLTIDGHSHSIDATGCATRVLSMSHPSGQATLTFSHVGITGGSILASTSCTDGNGAGLSSANYDVVLDHMAVFGNTTTNTVDNNPCPIGGAGVYHNGGFGGLTVRNSTISNNTAQCTATCADAIGAGLLVFGAAPFALVNSTVSDNVSSGTNTFGGGVATNTTSVSFVSSTIVNNSALHGSNFYNFPFPSNMSAFGTVIALAQGGGSNCLGDAATQSYNLEDGGAPGTCGFSGGTSLHAAPALGGLADNGGVTLTRAPGTGSPLINAIPNASCQSDGAANWVTDQRDFVRPNANGSSCDIGAVEVQPGGVSGTFTSLAPTRILDTRFGVGLSGAFAPQQTRDLDVTNTFSSGVPATGVEAVVLNVTATAPSAAGWLTLFPTGGALPTASNLNFLAGQTVPNLVVVKVGTGGQVSINNTGGNPSAGTAQVIADVVGYYGDATTVPAAKFTAITPNRILDTRSNLGLSGAFGPNQHRALTVTDGGVHVPDSAAAVVMNVTATAPSSAGWLTLSPTGGTFPNASNLNFLPAQTVPNLVVVPVGTGHQVDITNTDVPTLPHPPSGTVHVIADVVGYYDAAVGTPVVAVPPQRILDTRNGTGGVTGPVAPNATVTVNPRNAVGLPPVDFYSAVIVNVTATGPTQGGWLTAYPSDATIPNASNLNFVAGQTVPNLVKVKVGADGTFKITNTDVPTMPHPSSGTVHIIVDIVGWFR